jgi:hypothetical protein
MAVSFFNPILDLISIDARLPLSVLPEGEHAPASGHPLGREAVRVSLLSEEVFPQRSGDQINNELFLIRFFANLQMQEHSMTHIKTGDDFDCPVHCSFIFFYFGIINNAITYQCSIHVRCLAASANSRSIPCFASIWTKSTPSPPASRHIANDAPWSVAQNGLG